MVVEVSGVADQALAGARRVHKAGDDQRLDGEEISEVPRRVGRLIHDLNETVERHHKRRHFYPAATKASDGQVLSALLRVLHLFPFMYQKKRQPLSIAWEHPVRITRGHLLPAATGDTG